MFVVDVCTLVEPSLLRMSAGSPESRSVMATKEDHMRLAYSWRSPRVLRSRAAAGAASSSDSRTAGTAIVWTVIRIYVLPHSPMADQSEAVPGRAPIQSAPFG